MGRELQEFVPIENNSVGFYGCGPTVYNYAHIGNLRAFVFQDIVERTFRFLGYDVKHVMNITDIGHLTGDSDDGEDKMLKTAKERGKSVLEVADFYTQAFFTDIDELNINRPNIICKATEHIQEMIELIKRLEENGHTYSAGGNLYYDVSTFPAINALSGCTDDGPDVARVEVDENKRNKHDFVLWFTKSKFENQALVWDSPWGKGYPGWHIECSAMSMKYLGEHFDIHTGGIDHIPVHHTNEIAQSEGATNKKWVNYWLHNECLVIRSDDETEQKMSKSTGNFLTLTSLKEAGYHPLDYRFFLLGGHYRSQLFFSWPAMESAKNGRKALLSRLIKLHEEAGFCSLDGSAPQEISHYNDFRTALEEDFSTPKALSILQIMLKDTALSAENRLLLAMDFDRVLGLKLKESLLEARNSATDNEKDEEIQALVEERLAAKLAKNWARADEIRNLLNEKGIILEDTKEGTTWKRKM